MLKSSTIFASFALLLAVVQSADVNFNCVDIPETCNNMCFHSNNFHYTEMVFDDPTQATKDARRRAAGCGGNNRCITNPQPNGRSTCDEYPFASTTGWYIATGAGTRCVSLDECRSQGGSISAAYRRFGRVAGTPIDAVFEFDTNDPNSYCANPGKADDGGFQQGTQPPVRRSVSSLQGRRSSPLPQNWYRLASGRKVMAIGRELANGTNVFIPNNWWANRTALMKRQDDDNDGCGATQAAIFAAVEDVPYENLGTYDPVIEHITKS